MVLTNPIHDFFWKPTSGCNNNNMNKPRLLSCRPTSGCTTIGGGDPGASCKFPFIYRDVEYNG